MSLSHPCGHYKCEFGCLPLRQESTQEQGRDRVTGTADMPNLPCARSTGKGSTLGPLTKCRRVGAGPALGWDKLKLPESETSAVSEGAGPLWPENARKRRKVGKADETLALKGETK